MILQRFEDYPSIVTAGKHLNELHSDTLVLLYTIFVTI